MRADVVAVVSIIASGLLGSGGIGYALVSWWTKRNDDETRANAARILSDAASGIIVELRTERRAVADRLAKLQADTEALRRAVLDLVRLMASMTIHAEPDDLAALHAAVRTVEDRL